jgi:hypothetical protein
MWDSWYIAHAEMAHLFHLQKLLPGSHCSQNEADWIGHATSSDLVHWSPRMPALPPGESGSDDDLQPWTGCVVKDREGSFRLFYTMRASADQGRAQRIGLAISADLDHWRRWEHNPVIVPDSRWYVSREHPLSNGVVDCRDLVVVFDGERGRYLGYYAARLRKGDLAESACIAVVESEDLLHWWHLPPAFAPARYACLEVPDVFRLGDRWFLISLTGTWYGNRGLYVDPGISVGTIYATSDKPEGPFEESGGDNLLIGSGRNSGYGCRTLEFEGERYLFYTETNDSHFNILTVPKKLRVDSAGQLRAFYSNKLDLLAESTLIQRGEVPPIERVHPMPTWGLYSGSWVRSDNAYQGAATRGWQVGRLPVIAGNVEFDAEIILCSGVAAGLVVGLTPEMDSASLVLLDASEQVVAYGRMPRFDDLQKRKFPVEYGRPYRVALVIRGLQVEVYIDDVLWLQFGSFRPAGNLGLFVDRGEAQVRALRAVALIEEYAKGVLDS